MNFTRRITIFIFGVLLGSAMVWGMFFRNRTFPAWTPKGRILEALREHAIKISPNARCLLACNSIPNEDVVNLLSNAEVLLSESSIRGMEIPEYVLEGKGSTGKLYKMKFRSEYLTTYLITLIPTADARKTCDCNK
jgi:hypothetical protein